MLGFVAFAAQLTKQTKYLIAIWCNLILPDLAQSIQGAEVIEDSDLENSFQAALVSESVQLHGAEVIEDSDLKNSFQAALVSESPLFQSGPLSSGPLFISWQGLFTRRS